MKPAAGDEGGGATSAGADGAPDDAQAISPTIIDTMVPAGAALVGTWAYDPTSHAFVTRSDCDDTDAGADAGAPVVIAKRLAVPAVWLDSGPVMDGQYHDCVEAGACVAPVPDPDDPDSRPWDDPARANIPVFVSYTKAAAYCQWVGGRLPNIAELVRAAQGDATDMPGVAAMTHAVIDCYDGAKTDTYACGQLEQMDRSKPPYPFMHRDGAVALDEGPYEHFDLFGSVLEWTQSSYDPVSVLCKVPDGAPESVTLAPTAGGPDEDAESGDGQSSGVNDHDVLDLVSILYAVKYETDTGGIATDSIRMSDATERYPIGFRCAYDAEPAGGPPIRP